MQGPCEVERARRGGPALVGGVRVDVVLVERVEGGAERATGAGELDREVERRAPLLALVLDVRTLGPRERVHALEEGDEGGKVVEEVGRRGDEALNRRALDEVREVREEVEVPALLGDEGRVEVERAVRWVGRKDEAGAIGRELAREERREDLEKARQEVVARDEEGGDRGDGEDLDAERDERVLGLAVGEEVGRRERRVDLGVLHACGRRKRARTVSQELARPRRRLHERVR